MIKNKKNKKPLIFFIGHFAIDTIIRFSKEHAPTLGGSVSFGSLSLRNYAKNVKIGIISNLGSLNFDKSMLDIIKRNDIDLKGIKWSETYNTNFVLDYHNHSRTLVLKYRSPDLQFEDIPKKYLKKPADIIVLAPLCNEISYEYINKITKQFPNAFIGIDLQGFIRKFDNSHVSVERDEKMIDNLAKIINVIGDKLVLKGSEEEMKILSGENNIYKSMEYFNNSDIKGIFIITLGESGSLIGRKGEKLLKVPAFRPYCVVDETGCGDVYFSIFLYEFIISDKSWKSIEKAAYMASSAASFNVEQTGPVGFQSKEIVTKRIESRNYIE